MFSIVEFLDVKPQLWVGGLWSPTPSRAPNLRLLPQSEVLFLDLFLSCLFQTVFLIFDNIIKGKMESNMKTIKQEALQAIASLPDSTEIEDIMYRLYVIDKIRQGQEDVLNGKFMTTEDFKKEISRW
jgi:hypothetical protein